MKLLSIIIPAYNAEKYVHRCLKSILACINIKDYEIILIDDGSTDNTLEVAERFINENKSEHIRVVHQKNSRQGAARNHGLKIAKGKYIMFVDVDDYLRPIDFTKHFQIAESNNLDILKFSFQVFNADGDYKIKSDTQFLEDKVYSGPEAILMDYTIGSVCAAIYRRDLFSEARISFREDIVHEDAEFMLRLLPQVKRMMFASACIYAYCWNDGSTDRCKSIENIIRSKKSDIIVAKSYIETAKSSDIDSLYNYYHRKSNSLMLHFLLSLIINKDKLPTNERLNLLNFAQSQSVYPMTFRGTLSWKTSLLQPLLNRPYIEKLFIKVLA